MTHSCMHATALVAPSILRAAPRHARRCVDTTVRRDANGLTVTLAVDAHTAHDKPHANAALIRAHHDAALSNIRSFGPKISAVRTGEIVFEPAA